MHSLNSFFEKSRCYDKMTPKERAQAIAEGKPVDRMPVYMFPEMITPHLIGKSMKLSEQTAKDIAEIQIEGYRMFGYDGVGLGHGLHSLPILMGGEFTEPENSARNLIGHPIKDTKDLTVLDLDNVVFSKDEAASKAFDALRYMRDEIGEEVNCTMNFTSPFTVASGLVGVDKFLIGLVREPEQMVKVFEFVTEAQFKLAKVFMDDGFTISTSDPVASCSVISPKVYHKYAKPYEQKFAQKCSTISGKPMGIHICGNTTKILDDVIDAGFVSFSLDNRVDLAVAKDKIGDKAYLSGNVDPVEIMLLGNEEDVVRAVHNCYRKAWDSPKGFAISTGCDLCYGTPLNNTKIYLEESKRCAIEQAKALQNPKEKYIWDDECYS